jgi:hypothetical protein
MESVECLVVGAGVIGLAVAGVKLPSSRVEAGSAPG